MSELLLSTREVAELLGVSKSVVYKMCYRRSIPYMVCGRSYRFRRSSIEKWLEESEQQPIPVKENTNGQENQVLTITEQENSCSAARA